jgi:FkbM family methyltransferase
MIRRAIKQALHRLGVEVTRYTPQASDRAKLARLLASHRVDCVFDVGANTGQYADELRDVGYGGRIISFEPQVEAHSVLLRRSRNDALWNVAPAMALGDSDGDTEINVSENSASSSILRMTKRHESCAPASQYIRKEKVPVRRLDSIFTQYVAGSVRPFLKIDTQGYESRVLDGAAGCIAHFIGVQAELSLFELYEGQELFFDVARRLCDAGFALVGLLPGFTDNLNGHLLQVDGLFFRINHRDQNLAAARR